MVTSMARGPKATCSHRISHGSTEQGAAGVLSCCANLHGNLEILLAAATTVPTEGLPLPRGPVGATAHMAMPSSVPAEAAASTGWCGRWNPRAVMRKEKQYDSDRPCCVLLIPDVLALGASLGGSPRL